jgi:hypothetical protein
LYAVIDILSRDIVTWCVATREDAEIAKTLIGLQTPASVHYGTAIEVHAMRDAVLYQAYTDNPARLMVDYLNNTPQPRWIT